MNEVKEVKRNNKKAIAIIIAALICLGAGFFAGMKYQGSQKSKDMPDNVQQNTLPNGKGSTNGRAGSAGNQPVSGEITSIDDGSITIKTQDGGSKIVTLSSSTAIKIANEGSISDLTEGDTVVVNGTTGSDGTVSAVTITIGGELMQLGGTAPQGQGPQGN